uniref:Putative ovule protein n=1 Tax=Solanum chacoense TaxID=4108 RepID=A0A0V0GR25_SOLCH
MLQFQSIGHTRQEFNIRRSINDCRCRQHFFNASDAEKCIPFNLLKQLLRNSYFILNWSWKCI